MQLSSKHGKKDFETWGNVYLPIKMFEMILIGLDILSYTL